MSAYRLNLNQQTNGDYEVHKEGCTYWPTQNYDSLGDYSSCTPAVTEAKRKHPYKKINGCKTCSNSCHTS
ncbi:MAG: hypothetical protein EOO87_03355 [Pedobacter sp.]|nr:MAG: hypothetical protein EOO87_03355 [Pedobacter sp.]